MPARRPEEEIARLYRLPLDEFTGARNALAKQASDTAIRSLVKPPLAAWAVNQVYWTRRPVYDALIDAAETLRAAHKAVLTGRTGDVRGAGQAHETKIEAATAAALSILSESGHPVTDATKHAIVTTLRALPAQEPPGRLGRTLQPGGFEMLAGLAIGRGATATRVKIPPPAAPGPKPKASPPGAARADAAALARARDAAAALERKIRDAEHAAKRQEFELARATRESERAEKHAAGARKALEEAQQALEEAEAAVATTARTRESAERRAKQAEQALEELTRTRVRPGS